MKSVRELPGIRKAFVSSGVRYDLITEDRRDGYGYLKDVFIVVWILDQFGLLTCKYFLLGH